MATPYIAALLAGVLLLSAPRPSAAHDDDAAGKPGEIIGEVHFPVTCNAAAQREFDRAVALYHSFWFDPANESYRKVAELDPGCAMAWWGLALSALANPFAWPAPPKVMEAGAGHIKKAQEVGAGSARERGYIDALARLFDNWETTDHRVRALGWEQGMEQVAAAHPEDSETQIFYALSLIANALPTDKTYASQLKAAAILEPMFQGRADHPGVAHYLIHAYDYTALVGKGLPAARRYSSIAPSAPHALHMPGHIFTRLGLWEDSIQTNIASAKAARAELQAKSQTLGSYNALHAMDYLMYAHLQLAQDQAARAIMDDLATIQKLDAGNFAAAHALAAIPVRYAMERRQWADLARLELHPKEMPWSQFPHAESIIFYGRALGAARTGNAAQARADIERLRQLKADIEAKKLAYWAQQADIQIAAASAWLAYAEGRKAEGLAGLRSAADMEEKTDKHPVTPGPIAPAREQLGEMLMEMDQPQAALAEFVRVKESEPNRYRALADAVRAALASGDSQLARSLADQLLQLTAKRDTERADLLEAQALLKN